MREFWSACSPLITRFWRGFGEVEGGMERGGRGAPIRTLLNLVYKRRVGRGGGSGFGDTYRFQTLARAGLHGTPSAQQDRRRWPG